MNRQRCAVITRIDQTLHALINDQEWIYACTLNLAIRRMWCECGASGRWPDGPWCVHCELMAITAELESL